MSKETGLKKCLNCSTHPSPETVNCIHCGRVPAESSSDATCSQTTSSAFNRKTICIAVIVVILLVLFFWLFEPIANALKPAVPAVRLKQAIMTGSYMESKETLDDVASETILKTIEDFNCSANQLIFKKGRDGVKVDVHCYILLHASQTQQLRVKIYRSATSDGKYSLIYNEELKNPPNAKTPAQTTELTATKYGRRTTSTNIGVSAKKNLSINVADAKPLDCGSNNVFYKVKLCLESGLLLLESEPMRVQLAPHAEISGDNKLWTWTPFFPGKDQLEGVLQNGATTITASNVELKGQVTSNLQSHVHPLISFRPVAIQKNSWYYSRHMQNIPYGFAQSVILVRPVFNEGNYFEMKGPIEFKSLKIDGRKVSIKADNYKRGTYNNGIKSMPIYKIPLNYPGTPVAELEFAYGGSVNSLRVQLPPVPTGLQAKTLEDGSVKLTWDPLAGRIDRKQIPVPPDIKLFRDQRLIHTCDINQTEFIDKQTEPGIIYRYSMALDNARVKVQGWTKENGIIETKVIMKDFANPYPENFQATAYVSPEKPQERPIRVSFWEPALCYPSAGSACMRLFSTAVRKLCQDDDFEVLDRISRNNVIEEKVLTMSYEKGTMINILPADFTVLVRDYSRSHGNGAELWLFQNKTFDYKEVKISKYKWFRPTYADDNFVAWRIGAISTDELKSPGKMEELNKKLVAEIKKRVFFKNSKQRKDASVPLKFVFNPLQTVRQQHTVEGNQAIGETIMIGLSNLMPGCNIMTRNNWKTIFEEQSLMRQKGETLNNDISGTVSVTGYVWQESGKKQYVFILTEIRSGICIGTLQCTGSVEEVTAQLAEACKKVKLTASRSNESTAQSNAEFERERSKIMSCFTGRFGVVISRELHQSLTAPQEISKSEFAEKQWQIGNREKAITIMENLWGSDKSVWEQLINYHCMMGNYTRALQIAEVMIQQKNASNKFVSEYYRLRAMAARNAPPEIIAYSDRRKNAMRENNSSASKDYFDRSLDRGIEWDFNNENQFMIKAYFAIAKNPDAKLDDVIGNNNDPFYFTSGTFWVERQDTKGGMACNTGRQFLEIKLKQALKKEHDPQRHIELEDMVCIDIMAQLGNSEAQRLLGEMNSIELPSSHEDLVKLLSGNYERTSLKTVLGPALLTLRDCNYNPCDLVAFRAYKGDRHACNLVIQRLKAGGSLGEGTCYLMSMAGRKEILAAMLPMTGYEAEKNISAIRWGNREMLKSLLIENHYLFDPGVFFYLIDGLDDLDFLDVLFSRKNLIFSSEYWTKSAFWLGKPLPELYRELSLNYKRGE